MIFGYVEFYSILEMADRGGFEPPIRYERIHAFQACAFNRSATCPTFFDWDWVPFIQEREFNRQWAMEPDGTH